MFVDLQVNYLAVFLAAIAAMTIGFLWYSPFLFGKVWIGLAGMSEQTLKEAKKKGMTKTCAAAFVNNLLMGFVLATILYLTAVPTPLDAVLITLIVWAGFVMTVLLGGVLWEGKPFKLYLINAGYYLVGMMVMSLIIFFVI